MRSCTCVRGQPVDMQDKSPIFRHTRQLHTSIYSAASKTRTFSGALAKRKTGHNTTACCPSRSCETASCPFFSFVLDKHSTRMCGMPMKAAMKRYMKARPTCRWLDKGATPRLRQLFPSVTSRAQMTSRSVVDSCSGHVMVPYGLELTRRQNRPTSTSCDGGISSASGDLRRRK